MGLVSIELAGAASCSSRLALSAFVFLQDHEDLLWHCGPWEVLQTILAEVNCINVGVD